MFAVRRMPPALVGVCAIVGFLLVVTGTATSAANRTEQPRKTALIDQILAERSRVDDYDKAVQALRDEVTTAQDSAGQASQRADAVKQGQTDLANAAGTTALKGDGLEVKVSDGPTPRGQSDASFGANRVQDGDLQLVVNALFAAGADAVAINDNRVVTVTPIRAAGGTIVVNYRPVTSPYRVVAIGADKKKFNDSDIALHFRQWSDKYDMGYSVSSHRNAQVPAYSGRVQIALAQPTGTSGATTSTTAKGPGDQ